MENDRKVQFINRIKKLSDYFFDYYNDRPEDVFSSPGRVELLGNHTDHNLGKVLVGTVDLSIIAVTKKTEDNYFVYKTDGFTEMKVDINDLEAREDEYNQSISLIRGVLYYLKEAGYHLGGVKVCTITNIFKGAGVSSSAAFEVLIGKIISYYYNENQISEIELAKCAQKAEINYFNKPCGLLDQAGISLGGVNFIDFYNKENPYARRLRFSLKKYDVVLTYCLDSHSALTAHYAKIKDDLALLSTHFNVPYLRYVTFKNYLSSKEELIEKYGEDIYLRGEHFFEENLRVDKALDAIYNKDEDAFVKCIEESGNSSFYKLKNCYVENQDENLAKGILFSKSININGGTRVHGGGFAGTMLAFVRKEESQDYINEMKKLFGAKNVRKLVLSKFGTRYVAKLDELIKEME